MAVKATCLLSILWKIQNSSFVIISNNFFSVYTYVYIYICVYVCSLSRSSVQLLSSQIKEQLSKLNEFSVLQFKPNEPSKTKYRLLLFVNANYLKELQLQLDYILIMNAPRLYSWKRRLRKRLILCLLMSLVVYCVRRRYHPSIRLFLNCLLVLNAI